MKPALDNQTPQVFNPILSLEGICRSHGIGSAESVTILDQLTLEAHSGTLTVIRGESGSGKTSLLRIIGLLDQDFSGRYEMLGKRVDGQPDWYLDDLRAANIGFIFQEGRLFSHLTLRQNIDFPARIFLHENFEERTERINTLAQHHFRPDELAGGVLDNTPARVSGGQRQRAAILRALPASPCIILADEPTASLHGDLKREIVRMLEELQQAGHCVIVVSHDDVFYGIGRQLILHEGKLHEISSINQILDTTKRLPIQFPASGPSLLWGWKPRTNWGLLLQQAIQESLFRPLFMILILTSLVLGVCQIVVFSSILRGTGSYIEQVMASGSRLNRVEIKPISSDMAETNRFPKRDEIAAWPEVLDVISRRIATVSVLGLENAETPYPAMGLHTNDPEYGMFDFVAGRPFASEDALEVIVTASLLAQVPQSLQQGEQDRSFEDYIGKTLTIQLPQFNKSGKVIKTTSVQLRISGIILEGESGRQLYLPNSTLLVFDSFKRDRSPSAALPIDPITQTWSDLVLMRQMTDWPWEDKLQVYTSEIKQVVPIFTKLSKLGFRPSSEIWAYKWVLDLQETLWRIFLPLAAMIVGLVAVSVFANIFTSTKLREAELALWRVLGMRRGDIVVIQLLSNFILTLLGCTIGLLGGQYLIITLRNTLARQAEQSLAASGTPSQGFDALFAPIGPMVLPIILGALVISFTAALYPSIRAALVDPAKVLTA